MPTTLQEFIRNGVQYRFRRYNLSGNPYITGYHKRNNPPPSRATLWQLQTFRNNQWVPVMSTTKIGTYNLWLKQFGLK